MHASRLTTKKYVSSLNMAVAISNNAGNKIINILSKSIFAGLFFLPIIY
tara:strand:- start:295 stop:441 length:147 start_codon:yes stop_codon:yes gene_type:complete